MASSSSAKKVARVAARSGPGTKTKKQSNWLFPVAIVAIVALGVAAVLYARDLNSGSSDNSQRPRANLANGEPFDHWHDAFEINVCGKERPPLNDVQADTLGIHSHGDGLIHVHPFATRASGDRATLGKFFDQVGLKVTETGFRLPEEAAIDGDTRVQEGETTCGGKPGELVLAHWKDARTAGTGKPDQIITKDFAAVKLTEDLGAYTLAFVPKGDRDIPPPSSSQQIEELGSLDGGDTPAEAPQVGGTTVPGAEQAPEGGGQPPPEGGGQPPAPQPGDPADPAAGG